MTTFARAITAVTSPSAPRRDVFRILLLETRCELLKLLRTPSFLAPTFAFPILFYVLFGLLLGGKLGGAHASSYLLVSYTAAGVFGAHLFALGVSVAAERGMGWLRLKRATPMPATIHFAARMLVALGFGAVLVLVMFALGAVFGGVALPRETWLRLGGWLILGGIPFSAFGLAIGHLLGAQAAPAVLNLLYLPMSFASGLWLPIFLMPDWLQTAARALPPYHLGAQGHALLGAPGDPPAFAVSLAVLGLFTAVSLALGLWAWRRDAND